MTTQGFPTLDVVTVTTGRLVSDRGIDSVYEVCGYVLGDDGLMTHQLPAASRACEPVLYAQHPWLAELEPPESLADLKAWCATVVEERGPVMAIRPATDGERMWQVGNAMRDLLDIAAGRPVISVEQE
jgi:hypothetical protein